MCSIVIMVNFPDMEQVVGRAVNRSSGGEPGASPTPWTPQPKEVPLLGRPPILELPLNKLASESNLICLMYGMKDSNFKGFRGLVTLCCPIVNGMSQCEGENGCQSLGWQGVLGRKCLMFAMKEAWRRGNMPLKANDYHIVRTFKEVKRRFDKEMSKKFVKESDIDKFSKTTVNLAPKDRAATKVDVLKIMNIVKPAPLEIFEAFRKTAKSAKS